MIQNINQMVTHTQPTHLSQPHPNKEGVSPFLPRPNSLPTLPVEQTPLPPPPQPSFRGRILSSTADSTLSLRQSLDRGEYSPIWARQTSSDITKPPTLSRSQPEISVPFRIYAKPLNQLTIKIKDFFCTIQTKYINNINAEVPDPQHDDENFDYKIMKGEVFANRYKAESALGKGTFGQVVKCIDLQTGEYVALKIIKSQMVYTLQAQKEVELLKDINTEDSADEYGIVRLLSYFTHHRHLCLVFELLSLNLFEVVQKFKGLSLLLIRKIAYQALTSLYFLSEEGVDIIHGDLKPENILLRDPTKSGVKIIDFGSSCLRTQRLFTYIQSRFYRAPEVLLEVEYSQAIDMWSLGCILVELHVGEPLFAGKNEKDQLQKICEVLGPLPESMTKASTKFANYFCEDDQYSYERYTDKFCSRTLVSILDSCVNTRWRGKQGHQKENYARFLDLLTLMLSYDPEHRIKPMEALHHPFFTLEHNWCDVPAKEDGPTGRKRRPNSIITGRSTRAPKKCQKHVGNAHCRFSKSE